MSNTERAYQAMRTFGEKRAEAIAAYKARREMLKTAKGSKYYADEMKNAHDKMLSDIQAAEAKARSELGTAVAWMRKSIGQMKVPVPSDDVIRVLQVLKMRDHLTEADLVQAARAINGDGMGMQVIQELARKNRLPLSGVGQLVTENLTAEGAEAAVQSLERACNRFFASPAKRGAVLAEKMRSERYGGAQEEVDLPAEENFTSERDFLLRTVSNTNIDLFSGTVNEL